MIHNYKDKFNMDLLKNKIVMAFTDPINGENPYKYFTDNFTGEGIHKYYIFNTPKDFINKWEKIYNKPNGMWYWCLDNGYCFCSGAVDPEDIEIFIEYFNNNNINRK